MVLFLDKGILEGLGIRFYIVHIPVVCLKSHRADTVLLAQAAPQQMPPPGAVFAAPMMEVPALDQKHRGLKSSFKVLFKG